MYVTRRLSELLKDESGVSLSVAPEEGPNSGYLVISDEEAENGLGIRRDDRIRNLPFPQNKDLTVATKDESYHRLIFIPVLNLPLSANRYYVICTHGWDEGEAITSSKEDDKMICCWCEHIQDASPCALDHLNEYQQFEISVRPRHRFEAKSIAPDGFPPMFLRGEWKLNNNIPHHHLTQALGLNSSLRAQLPPLNFPSSHDLSPQVVVGKWYCPFMFVREQGKRSKDMMKKSMFYEMTLEQRWVKILSKENDSKSSSEEIKEVVVEVVVQTQAARISGTKEAVWDEKDVRGESSGILWFTSNNYSGDGGKGKKGKKGKNDNEEKIGLSMAIVERMKWEEERVGWVGSSGNNQRIVSVEKFEGNGMWKKFSCYMLMETFVLKTMDGNLVLTCDYKHTNQIRCIWE